MSLRRIFTLAVVLAAGANVAVGCSGWDKVPSDDERVTIGYDYTCDVTGQPGQGDLCSRDCLTARCNSELGRRACTCEGGVYLQCVCLPPDGWPYDTSPTPTAPYCDEITGQPRYLDNPENPVGERCAAPGTQCISKTFPAEGCNCVASATVAGIANWECGMADALGIAPGVRTCESFGTGLLPVLRSNDCTDLWQLCVARDYYRPSTTPRGCACLDRGGGRLEWVCGSTNRWFRPE